ncbi:MAG: hypothetical protein LBO05_12740 [Deltaproteobacteria bacterium]|nr:hypothetical protein [Deltaproteobacteria bacterium]
MVMAKEYLFLVSSPHKVSKRAVSEGLPSVMTTDRGSRSPLSLEDEFFTSLEYSWRIGHKASP